MPLPVTTKTKESVVSTCKVPKIIGLPPETNISDNIRHDAYPVMTIHPCEPQFTAGMSVFTLSHEEGRTNYNALALSHGIDAASPIKVAFLADSFPTESFSNDYGESFLGGIGENVASGLTDMAQMVGARSLSEGVDKLGKGMKDVGSFLQQPAEGGEEAGGLSRLMGEGFNKGAQALTAANNYAKSLKSRMSANGGVSAAAARMGGLLSNILSGQRVDFPMIWKSSSFGPTYSITVRLYNPFPESDEATSNYIVGPLGALLLLGLPRSKEGETFYWPFYHKIEVPGLLSLRAAAINNISVIKGGDQQNVAYNQRPGIIDVRIDFVTLYSTMLAVEGGQSLVQTPTLSWYLDNLRKKRTVYDTHVSSRTEDLVPVTGAAAPVGVVASGAEFDTSVSRVQSTHSTIHASLTTATSKKVRT